MAKKNLTEWTATTERQKEKQRIVSQKLRTEVKEGIKYGREK